MLLQNAIHIKYTTGNVFQVCLIRWEKSLNEKPNWQLSQLFLTSLPVFIP